MNAHRVGPAIAAGFLCMASATAMAQPPTDRESDLEKLVHQLAAKVDQLESRLAQLEGAPPGGTTARVEKLEQSVERLRKERPPASDSEEWAKISKWVNDDSTLRPYWKDGLRLDSNDGAFKLKIGGRIQHDYAYFVEDGDIERRIGTDFDDGTEFRRARLYFSGTIYDDIEFKVQYDFAGGDADFKDVFMGMRNIPSVGHVRIGQFKEPFSLEELTSSNYLTFMERSLVNTFAPGRNVGLMFRDTLRDERMTWAAGVFRQTDSFGDGVGGRDYDLSARVTGLPVYEDAGNRLVHVGLSYAHRNYESDTIRFSARPEAHVSPGLVDTGVFGAEHGDFVGAEAALVSGPFSLQGEYVHGFINGDGPLVGNPRFWAASVQASYFLTGEHRRYKTASGVFDRVRPILNFGKDGGLGAWELATRFSYLTLNDDGVDGGRLRDLTFGLNWYLNPSVRTMWNYVWADPTDGGDVSAFMWRFQLAF